MTDAFERKIGEIDAPRALDPGFRDRLEHAIMGVAGTADAAATPWSIDGPRDLPPPARARIEVAMARRNRWVLSPLKMFAAAVAVLLVASATVVVVDRVGKRGGGGEDRPFVAAPSNSPSPTSSPSTVRAKPSGPSALRGFKSASQFLAYVRAEGLKQNGPYGIQGSTGGWYGGPMRVPTFGPAPVPGSLPQPAPMMPSTQFSTTNIQEAGVDEPDIVKTDGRHMVVLMGSAEHAGSVLRLFDVKKGARFTDSVEITESSGIGTFLAGDRVIVFSRRFEAPPQARWATHVTARSWTKVTVISIADPERLKVLSSMEMEGSYVDARLAGGVVRLVISSNALGPPPAPVGKGSPQELDEAEKANERSIRRSSVGDWVPHFVLERTGEATITGHVHDWSAISRPPDPAGLGMLTVLTIDPAHPAPDNALSVVGAGDGIYASLGNLYVTSNRWEDTIAARNGQPSSRVVTRIHKFDISDPARTIYVASGEAPGFLLNQFSMSEYAGRLRVATTVESFDGKTQSSESFVTVLSEVGGKLLTVGSVGNLGLGERIYSVRFIDAMAYVVTFRQMDPLYVVDLRRPNHPRVRGQLKVPGFSEYLHPISETLLLGVGRDASDSGQAKGLQFSLFDVSDPANPRRLHNHIEGPYGYSGLDNDHHAFLYWAPRRLIVVPAAISDTWSDHTDFIGALALTVSETVGFGEPIRITHVGRKGAEGGYRYPDIQRSLVVGNRLITVSAVGLLLSSLETFEDLAWVPFTQ